MLVIRISPETTKDYKAIKDAYLHRRETKTATPLTELQVVDSLQVHKRSKPLKTHLENLSKLVIDDTTLEQRLKHIAIAKKYMRGEIPTATERSLPQIRSQFQAFENILAGNLDGITVIPLSAGSFRDFTLAQFLDLDSFNTILLDDPRKLPLFYTPQKDIDLERLGLNDVQKDKLKSYLFKRDEMYSRDTVEVTETSKPCLLDDLEYLKTPDKFNISINRDIRSAVLSAEKVSKVVDEVSNSRIRFDIVPSARYVDISTYMTFAELRKHFGTIAS